MPTKNWLVVGVSGVTGGGKSLMASKLLSLFPNSKYLCSDRFFLDGDDPGHQEVPGLQHVNWEIPSAIDLEAWKKSVQHVLDGTEDRRDPGSCSPDDKKLPEVIKSFDPDVAVPDVRGLNILILDGFLIFNDQWTSGLCDLKFYLTLTREQCLERRNWRHYDTPDKPGYFEICVWPEHVRMKELASNLNPDLVFVDGYNDRVANLNRMLDALRNWSA